MDITYFAAVDEDYNLPPKIQTQLAKSNELKHLILPMSKSNRNKLKNEELWDGRLIYNTSSKVIEIWKESLEKWVISLDSQYTPPPPSKPWDLAFRLPKIVRQRLAESYDFKTRSYVFSQSDVSKLTPEVLWDGMLIYNTTLKRHQVWVQASLSWVNLLNGADSFPPRLQDTLRRVSDSRLLLGNSSTIWPQSSDGFYNQLQYVKQENKVTCYWLQKWFIPNNMPSYSNLPILAPLPPTALPVIPSGMSCIGSASFTIGLVSGGSLTYRTVPGLIAVHGGNNYASIYFRKVNTDQGFAPLIEDPWCNHYGSFKAKLTYEIS